EHRKDVVLLDEGSHLVGVLGGVGAVVEGEFELDLAAVHSPLCVHHVEIRTNSVEYRREGGRDWPGQRGDAADDDTRWHHTLDVAVVRDRRLGIPARSREKANRRERAERLTRTAHAPTPCSQHRRSSPACGPYQASSRPCRPCRTSSHSAGDARDAGGCDETANGLPP